MGRGPALACRGQASNDASNPRPGLWRDPPFGTWDPPVTQTSRSSTARVVERMASNEVTSSLRRDRDPFRQRSLVGALR
jgi:hypothetical protein